jgi:hypothetical protein
LPTHSAACSYKGSGITVFRNSLLFSSFVVYMDLFKQAFGDALGAFWLGLFPASSLNGWLMAAELRWLLRLLLLLPSVLPIAAAAAFAAIVAVAVAATAVAATVWPLPSPSLLLPSKDSTRLRAF